MLRGFVVAVFLALLPGGCSGEDDTTRIVDLDVEGLRALCESVADRILTCQDEVYCFGDVQCRPSLIASCTSSAEGLPCLVSRFQTCVDEDLETCEGTANGPADRCLAQCVLPEEE